MLKLITAAAIAAAGLTLSPSPAKAQTLYQQVFATCLQNAGGRMDLCHPYTRCFVYLAANRTYMLANMIDQKCTQHVRTGMDYTFMY